MGSNEPRIWQSSKLPLRKQDRSKNWDYQVSRLHGSSQVRFKVGARSLSALPLPNFGVPIRHRSPVLSYNCINSKHLFPFLSGSHLRDVLLGPILSDFQPVSRSFLKPEPMSDTYAGIESAKPNKTPAIPNRFLREHRLRRYVDRY